MASIHMKFTWIADLLPDNMAPAIEGMIDQGAAAMQRALDSVR